MNDEQLEADIREALRRRAATIAAQADERLLDREYRPRTIATRRLAVALAPLAVGALAAVGAILAVGLGGATTRALAGWAPSPNPPLSGQAGAAEAACRAYMPSSAALQHAREDATGAGGHPVEPALAVSPDMLPLAAVDTRGVYTLVLLASGGERATCLIGPWPVSKPLFGSQGDGGSSATAPAPGTIGGLDYGFSRLAGEEAAMSVSGQAGPGVKAVTLLLRDGTQVAATVASSWFVAWWPGTDPAVQAVVTGAETSTTVALADPLARAKDQQQIVSPAVAARRMGLKASAPRRG